MAGDGNATAYQRHAQIDRIINRRTGGGIEHAAAHCRWQSAGGHLTAGDRLDQLLFGALWVAGLQHLHHNVAAGGTFLL